MLTTLIVAAIVTTVMVAGAATYHATDGFGAGNKTKSSLDVKREREQEQMKQEAARAEEEVKGSIESNGRFFVPRAKRRETRVTKTTEAAQSEQTSSVTLPTVQTLPTLQTGYYWQEYTPEQFDTRQQQAQAASQLFVDRYDTRANNGPLSTLINAQHNSGKFLEGAGLPRWALALCTLGFSEVYAQTASLIDSAIWDIDGDGTDSMIKNIFVDPWIEVANGNATWGEALLATALNTLNGATEVLDILANPIKGIANNGWQGFLDSFGLGGNGYVVYDWDTGNFALDLVAEIFSDPLTVISAVKGLVTAGTKVGTKVATKTSAKIGKETAEAVGKEITQEAVEKAAKESTEKLATRLQTEVAPKMINKTGKELTPAAQREVTKLVTEELAQRGMTEISNEAAEALYKTTIASLENTLGGKPLTATTLKKLSAKTLRQAVSDAATNSFKQLAKESTDKAIKKLYRTAAKFGVVNPDEVASRASRSYTQKLADIINEQGVEMGGRVGRGIGQGSITDVVLDSSGKPMIQTLKTVDNVEGVFKAADPFIESNIDTMFQRVVVNAKKAGVPMTQDTIRHLREGVEQFSKNVDFAKMTGQITSATGYIPRQARIAKAHKFAGWLKTADEHLNTFQKGLNKVALYGTAPAIPLIGKALGHTTTGKLLKRGAQDLFTIFFAKVTNDVAYNFQSAVARATKELTPESYALMRNAFSWASTETAEALAEGVEVGSKKVVMANKLLPQTSVSAYQRQWINKFTQDTRYYDRLVKNHKGNVTAINKEWEAYIRRTYKRNVSEYINFIEAVNSIERKATGVDVYRPYLNSIKANDAFLRATALSQTLESGKIVNNIEFMSPNVKQGRALSASELQALDPNIKVVKADEYNEARHTLTNEQVFIQTNNKVVIEQELYSEFSKILDDFEYFEGKEGLLADLRQIARDHFSRGSDFEKTLDLLEAKMIAAKDVNRQLNLLRANPALYAVVGEDAAARKELYVAMADAFMGLNNKVAGLDDVNSIARELASVAEIQLKTRGIIPDIPTGFLTQDADFMMNLTATIQTYIKTLPNGQFIISELKDAVPMLKRLADYTEAMYPGTKTAQTLYTLFDDLNLVTAKYSDDIIIMPSEVFRVGADVISDSSIHSALMKAAGPNFSGTLTTIADGVNVGKYFSGVSINDTFDIAIVEEAQRIANGAATIHDRIYLKVKDPEAVERIEQAWSDVLATLKRHKSMQNDAYFQQLNAILQATEGLDVNRKYSLLKYIYDINNMPPTQAMSEVHRVVKSIVDSDANYKLYRDVKNFMHITNHPVSIGVGLDVQRARKIYLTDTNQRAVGDLANIVRESKQVTHSSKSLELQIKNISNADPLLAQHLVQTKKLNEFYDNCVKKYQRLVEDAVDRRAITENLAIANSDEALAFLDEDDLLTLKELYDGVEDIDPDKIKKLEQRIDAYNKTVVSPDYFKDEIDWLAVEKKRDNLTVEDFSRLRRKVKNGEELTEAEKERLKLYKRVSSDYEEFTELMTKPTLTEKELDILHRKYLTKIERYDLTPNALKTYFVRQYKFANQTKISVKRIAGGATGAAGRSITVDSRLLSRYPKFQFVFRHETVHSALTFNDLMTHRKTVGQYWEHLMNGQNADYARNLYVATWYRYKTAENTSHYFDSDVFTWNNLNIKEEVMANIIAGQSAPEFTEDILKSYSEYIPAAQRRLLKPNATKCTYTEDFIYQNDLAFNQLVQNSVHKSPNQMFDMPPLHEGYRLDLNKPYLEVGDMMRDYRNAETNRRRNMLRKRLSQGAEDMARDLATTGPFHFYSISDIQNTKGRYSLYKYFDQDFNIRPKEYAALEAAGVHIEVNKDMDTVMFYIDKDRVAYYKGVSYYNSQPVGREAAQFGYSAKRWTSIDEAGEAFNNAMYEISGQTTGYSNGFRLDENFINTLFNGTKDGFDSEYPSWSGLRKLFKKDIGGWTQADLLQPAFYSTYRFNEMIMGDANYARRFGVYYSTNPMVNMSNALQQVQTMNKTKMEMTTMYFDETFAVSEKGIWGNYSDEELYKAYMAHPEMTFVTMRGKVDKAGNVAEQTSSKFTKVMLGDSWNPVRVQEFIPRSVKDIAKAREMGARFVPRSWYNQMYNTINNRIGSGGVMKYINRYNYIYKLFTLATNAMTFVRNAFDTYLKNTIELGDEMPMWTAYAWKLQADYQDVSKALMDLNIHGDKAIKEFFDSGMHRIYTKSKDMTYEMFIDLRNYEAWGPSTSGLADLMKNDSATILKTADDIDVATKLKLEPTDDELMRIIARDTVPGYKGAWENFVDINGRVFDIANNTVGAKAEKVNRLALYLKATAEGKTREQAFHWITKTHFDYSVRSLYEQSIEVLMPFMTFTMKNFTYWLEAIAKHPWAAKLIADYYQTQWAHYDFTPEQMAASQQWQYLIKSGNIPLWKRDDGMTAYFKLNPSFADAFNTFINPIEVAKDRLFFPTRALEKAFSTDYKGQNLFGKQDTWNKVLDLTAQFPGNALARRITNALKQTDVGSTMGELSGAVGHIKAEGYQPRRYGYKQRLKFVFNNNNKTYYKRMYSTPFRMTQPTNNSYKYQQISEQMAKWRRARNLDIGQRILDPYRALGQRLAKNIFFNNTLPKTQLNTTQTKKRWLSLVQYRVQRGLYE